MNTTSLKLLAATLLLLLTTGTDARPRWQGPGTPARTETKAYLQQNVLPVLRQQRQQLETRLSSADRTQLASYRTELHTLRQQAHTLRQAARPAAGTARPDLTPEQQQQRQQLRAATKALLLNVAQLARKYEADISQLTQPLQPQQQKWAADLAAIRARHTPASAEAAAAGPPRHAAASHLLRPVRFLLLDPAAPTQAPAGTAASLYPNPAVAASQLTYEMQKPGPVTVELLDGRGNTLRTVAQESRQDKGPHTLSIDLSDLPAGIYFYKISTRTGAETRRFVKE
ncbi:T9SS type A sorting domain-containing protein [Hymenobacter yonginensis]|uniref:T9SS type A sorting domain-containing protein n=1 Tax=Hymenobacter yonginensis TaxID=748197 RepID=A0ABY7PR13_9BACT|nr:T9SS type A sorting domain-containing protein [Hymenobacter yonginensis]WBO85125.1 T9SS type A sorting domain-containing protein [Hymenobacter yonginensis]